MWDAVTAGFQRVQESLDQALGEPKKVFRT